MCSAAWPLIRDDTDHWNLERAVLIRRAPPCLGSHHSQVGRAPPGDVDQVAAMRVFRALAGRRRQENARERQARTMAEVPQVQPTADVDDRAVLGPGTTVWHLAQIRENARLGRGCIVGRGAYVGPGVIAGDHVKLQNYALVYEPARLEDSVFIGPAAVLTNDTYPRSVDVSGKLKRPSDWHASGVIIRTGASIGARAVVLPGCEIGQWALVAAGAVVTRDVPGFALVAGVPARRIGWVGRAGHRLVEDTPGRWRCPQTGECYTEKGDSLLPD